MTEKEILHNNFNLLRLLAALQVVFIHGLEHLHVKNEIALFIKSVVIYFPGVPIFFLISGYLISMSYDKNPNIKVYAKNRFLRIIPGLYASFFVGLLILWYFGQFNDVSVMDVLPWIVAQLTLFQFYNPEFIRDFGVGVINGSLWTISVELVFYITLPLLYLFLQKDFYKKLLFLSIISLGFYYYIHYVSTNLLIYEKLIKVSIMPYLFYFLIGMFFYKKREFTQSYLEDKMFVYLALYAAVCYLHVDFFVYDVFKQLVFALFVFSFVFSYKNLSYKLMKHNDFTYGVYIYHMLIVNVFVQKEHLGGVEYLMTVLVFSALCGILSYFLIEKPFLSMKKKSLYNQLHDKEL